ncbi:hypothetical protein PG989_004667 [Apiospora arundinis]
MQNEDLKLRRNPARAKEELTSHCAVVVTGPSWSVTCVRLAVVLVTFLEFRPFERYWKRSPEPATCTRAYVQLLVQTTGRQTLSRVIQNIALDVVVLIVASPLTRLSKHSWSKRLRVYLLVGMGLICIGITIARAVEIFKMPNQSVRSIWASVQITFAVFVGNAPSMYGSAKILRRRMTTNDRSFGIADSNDSTFLPPLVGIIIARAVEIYKMPNQSVRSIWASVTITVAIFVKNPLSIYGNREQIARCETWDDQDSRKPRHSTF